MDKTRNMIGRRFGRLLIVSRAPNNRYRQSTWSCVCDCGNMCVRPAGQLRQFEKKARGQSCGCWRNELAADRRRAAATHGLTTEAAGSVSHKLYDVWRQILRRCENPRCKDYPAYGGRGIRLCEAWHDGATFIDWCISSGYQEGLTIERSDVNGHYEPDNCTWIPNPLQSKNMRKNRFLTHSGKTLCLSEWAKLLGFPVTTIVGRHRAGWDTDRILTTPSVIGRNQFG
jgi:hypothetical protein